MARIMARICNYRKKYPTVIISPHPKKGEIPIPLRGGVAFRLAGMTGWFFFRETPKTATQ